MKYRESNLLNIPDRQFFESDEVCSIIGIRPYVLRFWETEFEEVAASLSTSGVKVYTKDDIEVLSEIKDLLFEQTFTIEKAKQELKKILTAKIVTISKAADEVLVDVTPLITEISIKPEFNQEKLNSAKEKLNHLLVMTNGLKTRHHWENI